MMLMYGTPDTLQYIDKCKVYNFNSLLDGYEKLYLVPPKEVGIYGMLGNMNNQFTSYTEYQFDVNYMNYIMGNDIPFMQFMKIIMDLYQGINVFLIISPDEWSIALIESLMKLIQQRYGINGVKIGSFDDFVYAEETEFTGYGLFNLDQDKERYSYIIAMQSGGKI